QLRWGRAGPAGHSPWEDTVRRDSAGEAEESQGSPRNPRRDLFPGLLPARSQGLLPGQQRRLEPGRRHGDGDTVISGVPAPPGITHLRIGEARQSGNPEWRCAMRRILFLLFALALVPSLAAAAGPFEKPLKKTCAELQNDGWTAPVDPQTNKPAKAEMSIAGAMYLCMLTHTLKPAGSGHAPDMQ